MYDFMAGGKIGQEVPSILRLSLLVGFGLYLRL